MKNQNLSTITKNFILFRSYSRLIFEKNEKESWNDIISRNKNELKDIGNLNEEQLNLIEKYQREFKSIISGRFLWIGGTKWFKEQSNYYGAYNCTGIGLESTKDIERVANLGMVGCGTGVSLESKYIKNFPVVENNFDVKVLDNIGDYYNQGFTVKDTDIVNQDNEITIYIGDSRQGWCEGIRQFLDLFFKKRETNEVYIDLGFVRPKGKVLKGFGGVANPSKLPWLFEELTKIMKRNQGQKLNSKEHCLILDSIALMTVSGNIRRVAGLRQFNSNEKNFKKDLWQKDNEGNWFIQQDKHQMTVANHTHVFHRKPTYEEIYQSIESQYYSGEGALQYAPESVARSNADAIQLKEEKFNFLEKYNEVPEKAELYLKHLCLKNLKYIPNEKELKHRMNRYLLNPCGEIFSKDFLCNLAEIHLNQINPFNLEEQRKAFQVGSWDTAVLLHQEFDDEKFQYSREKDPIVGVSFTGLFDFFVLLFGVSWLHWWEAGRPKDGEFITNHKEIFEPISKIDENLKEIIENWASDITSKDSDLFEKIESFFLNYWRSIVEFEVKSYCENNNLPIPNRVTTVQPAGSKSLLTGASSGWSPPIDRYYIRRMSFAKNDPIAKVALEQGFSVVPNSTDIDEEGKLIEDIYDDRVSNWLVEVPVKVPWADLEGVNEINFKFPAISQTRFWEVIQNNYTQHNTSATIVLEEEEIETVADWLHNNIENQNGYSSIAFMGRCDNFPLMPFEAITAEKYNEMIQPLIENNAFSEEDFLSRLNSKNLLPEENSGPMQCDSDRCFN